MMAKPVPSRGSDQFMVRFPEGMREWIKAVADQNGRSMNSEIIHLIEHGLTSANNQITPRDLFAAAALNALIGADAKTVESVEVKSFFIADAMMKVKSIMTTPICPKCQIESRLTTGEEIYPHRPDLAKKHYYKCDRCGGYVGCHGTTFIPLGTPADAGLRKARNAVHSIIDPLWKRQKARKKARGMVYGYLSLKMGIPCDETHVGMFDLERCRQAYELMQTVTFTDIEQECLCGEEALQ